MLINIGTRIVNLDNITSITGEKEGNQSILWFYGLKGEELFGVRGNAERIKNMMDGLRLLPGVAEV